MITAVVIVVAIVVTIVAFAGFVRVTIRHESKALTDQIDSCIKAMAGVLKVKFDDIRRRLEALEGDAR